MWFALRELDDVVGPSVKALRSSDFAVAQLTLDGIHPSPPTSCCSTRCLRHGTRLRTVWGAGF
jgi:hypothetical protein